jgi:2-polyprenyl-6-methoxyphenol hydroxylase-like FAD-dependent oxidoreductase
LKAVICGAGIAGLTLAQRLATSGWEVTVVERAPGPRSGGYMMDFFGPGYRVAEQMGLLDRLAELSYRVSELAYVDDRGRRRAGLSFDGFRAGVGGRLLSLMRPDLELALRESADGLVDLRYGLSVVGFENQSSEVAVTLTDGRELTADLLVGADGIHSEVRGLLFGPDDRYLRPLGMHTAAYTFSSEPAHRAIGNRFCLTDTIDLMLGCYALRGGQVAAFVVHRTDDRDVPADRRAALRSIYADVGWIVPAALAACPPDEEIYYDQVAQVELPQWHRGRVVLVGDACGAVSLLAGQGASLAMAGADALARQLAAAGSVPTALERHQREWQPLVTAKQRIARRGAGWFLPGNQARLLARRAMLAGADLPGAHRWIASALVGKTGGVAGPATSDLER